MPGSTRLRQPDRIPTILLGIDPHLVVEVARCLCAAVGKPDTIVAEPAREAAICRRLHLIATVPATWFADESEHLTDLLRRTCHGGYGPMLVPADLPALRFLLRNADTLRNARTIPLPALDMLDHLDSKAWIADNAPQWGIPQPNTVILRCDDIASVTGVRYPAICKSATGEGGSGNRVVQNAEDLRRHVDAVKPTAANPLVVQEWVEGEDVGVSLLADHGRIIAWTVQRHLPHKVLRFEDHPVAAEHAQRLVAETNYTGIAHIDFQEPFGTRQPLILECNPRFWASVARAGYVGVNFPGLAVRMAAGEQLATQTGPVTGECGGFRHAARSLQRGGIPAPATRAWIAERLLDPMPYLHQKLSSLTKHARASCQRIGLPR